MHKHCIVERVAPSSQGNGRAALAIRVLIQVSALTTLFLAACGESGYATTREDVYLYKDFDSCHISRVPGPSHLNEMKSISSSPRSVIPKDTEMTIVEVRTRKDFLCMSVSTEYQRGWVLYHARYFQSPPRLPQPALSCQ